MADATSCLQTLRLHSSSAINKLSNDRLEQTNIKRAFWSIYSMEKLYSLQEGLLPVSSSSCNKVFHRIILETDDSLMATTTNSVLSS